MEVIPLFALSVLLMGAVGAAVANLHALLERVDLGDIPPDERANQTYGEGTAHLVRRLQERLNLQPARPGEVDEPTARAVNEHALEQGIFALVFGRIAGAMPPPAVPLTVRVVDADNLGGLVCAEVKTEEGGTYFAFYDPRFYLPGRPGVLTRKEVVDVVVLVLAGAGTELARSATFPRPEPKLRVDLEASEQVGLRVRGHVFARGGAPLSGVQIELFDRDIGAERQPLGAHNPPHVTDAAGAFAIPYQLPHFVAGEGERGKPTADLLFAFTMDGRSIEAFDIVRLPVDGDDTITTDLPFPAPEQVLGIPARDDELVRIVLTGIDAPRGPSEFETLLKSLAPLTNRRPLAEFDEAGTRDVSFAAREIGVDRALVADLVAAHRLARDPFAGAAPSALYGLARVLGAREPREIAARRVDELVAGLQQAMDSLIIPLLEGDVPGIAAGLHAVAVRAALAVRPDGAAGALNDVLADVLPDPDARARLLADAVNHSGSDAEFWTHFAADHPEVPVAPVQYALHLGTLTGNNVPLMTALRQEQPDATSMRALALHLDGARLETLIRDTGAMPSDTREGEAPAAAQARLAGEINGLLEAAQPTAVVARLARTWHAADPESVAAPVADVLDRAVLHTEFDLATGTVDELVEHHAGVLFDGMADPAARATTVDGLKRVQRLFQVSSDPQALGAVLTRRSVTGQPFRGALDIARFGKRAFLARFADAPAAVQGSLALMHDRSRSLADTVANLVVGQHQDARDVQPAAAGDVLRLGTDPDGGAPSGPPLPAGNVPGPGAPSGPPLPAVEDIPSWSDFFGGAEVCECGECRSVMGAAAYLVDQFEFLDKRCEDNDNGVTPLDVLIGHPTKRLTAGAPAGITGRRPDLAHIKLSCANTTTTIPTIDLINQILESVVAFGQTTPLQVDATGAALDPPRLSPNEPSPGVTGPELSAAPEHVVELAYRFVGGAVFPISLPYDRLLTTARAHMRQAGTSRAELIRLFGAGDAEAREAAVSAEGLGLLARDVEILTGAKLSGAALDAPIPTETLYGFPAVDPDAVDPAWVVQIATARPLLAALELSFEELVALVRTRFVGGEVPTADEADVAARLFLDVEQLKALRESGFVVEPDSETARALDRGGLTAADVEAFVAARAERLATTIVLDPPTSCDPDTTVLRHLDASPVSAGEWLALHRFVRLAKRMGLSFEALDVALFAVGQAPGSAFSPATLGRLAGLKGLTEALDLPWPVAASLVGEIDAHGPASLYDHLFSARGFARVHPHFRRGPQGEVLATGAPIDAGIPALAAAFAIDPARLKELLSRLALQKLDLPSVSAVHRTVVLARALDLTPGELLGLRASLGEPSLAEMPAAAPEPLVRFVERARRMAGAGISATTVAYLVGAAGEPGEGTGRSTAELSTIADALPAVLAPHTSREDRERVEEDERRTAGDPFLPEQIEQRKVAALAGRRQAAFAHLVQAIGLSPEIMALLVGAGVADGTARRSLLRTGEGAAGDAVALFSAPITASDRPTAERLLLALERVGVLVTATGLDPSSFELATHVAGLLTPDFVAALTAGSPNRTVVAAALDRLAGFAVLVRETKRPTALARAIKALAASAGGDWSEEALAAASAWLDLPVETVAAVPRDSAPELLTAAARTKPVDALAALRQRLSVARRLGVEASLLPDVVAEPISAEALARLVAGVRSQYEASAWLDVGRQLSDPIREASRDALVAFLVKRDGLKHADQLFSRYYIDTQTNAFVLTSPIRQAIFAVQTYVTRCLMGFERLNGVAPEQINAEEWKTISRLPVWAARQSTLLYPEELLDPSWRDNKTKGFRDFEATIRQTDVTPVNAAAAYGAFLDAFRVIASLEVCGTFLQTTFEGQEQGLFTSVLHVVGRTRGGVPRRYFYRRLNGHGNYEEWTDWTPIDADIQGIERDRPGGRVQGSNETLYEPGVHVLPVVWRGQVHLFWPTLVRKVDVPSTPPLVDAKNPTIKGRFSEPYWEVKLCWTHREGEAWTPKEQSSALVETWWTDAVDSLGGTVDYGNSVYGPNVAPVDEPELPDPNRFVLKAHVDDVSDKPSLRIVLAERNAKSQPFARFAFSFARVASEMEASFATAIAGYSGDHPTFVASGALTASFMGLKGSGALSVVTSSKKPEGDRLFTPPGGFRLTTLNQSYGAHLEAPFFIGLSDRAYFATMKRGTTSVREEIANPVSTPKVTGFAIHAHLDDLSAFATAGVPLKALYDPNPWVRASASQVGMATAGLVQSVPAINGTVTPALASATISLESEVVYRVGPRYRMVPVETVHVAVTPFFHPFAERFVTTLKRDGLDALLTPEMQRLTLPTAATFAGSCAPNSQRVTAPKTEGVDFEASSPFGTINWEIFFFAPLTVAQKLWEQNHLDAALDVFHRAVFDPMASGPDPNDAWRFEGLRQAKSLRLDTLLAQLSLPDDDPEKQQIMAQVEAMRLYPFQAHRIARLRPSAYKKWALTQYVRLRLAKGDRHFRRFTPEDVNLSIPEYLIAAAVMGPQPELIPQRVTMPAMSYAELRPHLDDLGNVMFEAETKLVSLGQGAPVGAVDTTAAGMLQRGAIGYFGIPKNDKLLALWDEVADRLFKVRNGMNIDGIQIQLPLFPPRIDPALLAQAVAAGLDISAVLDALAAPRPKHTYRAMHRQAVELAEMVVRVGTALSDSREKRDAESIARLRASHEREMADMIRQARQKQVAEAEASRDALRAERQAPLIRWAHYRDLLGALDVSAPGPDVNVPATINSGRAWPKRPLTLVDASTIDFGPLQVIPDIAKGLALTAGPGLGIAASLLDERAGAIKLAGGNILAEEKQELQESFQAVRTTFDAAMLDSLASMMQIIPNFEGAAKPMGAGAAVHFGGQALAGALSATSRFKHATGAMHTFLASVYGKQAGYVLREREWVTQMNNAAADVLSVDQKLAVADIQVAAAMYQQTIQEKALVHAEQIETHLQEKFTATELHDFRITRQLQLFRRFFDVALERAQMAAASYTAERAERDAPKVPFVRVGRSDDARLELTAGYELLACLADMDRSYVATEAHGPQLIRHVSLKHVNPWALHSLRETGEAIFSLPEVLFDMDHAGHYDRRIRSVQVTVPCVTGPYAPVTGTLTLMSSRRRPQARLDAALKEDTATGQPSISLSSGRDDAGLFELSLQDSLYLPFQGLGVVSEWKLLLPPNIRHFNYRTISDVILTIRYTSTNGGEAFGNQVSAKIAQALDALKTAGHTDGPFQLVSLRHDLPDSWYRFQAGEGLAVSLATDILPYVLRHGLNPKLEEVQAIQLPKGAPAAAAQAAGIAQSGAVWSITLANVGPPAGLDDIYLLTRFKLG